MGPRFRFFAEGCQTKPVSNRLSAQRRLEDRLRGRQHLLLGEHVARWLERQCAIHRDCSKYHGRCGTRFRFG